MVKTNSVNKKQRGKKFISKEHLKKITSEENQNCPGHKRFNLSLKPFHFVRRILLLSTFNVCPREDSQSVLLKI